MQQVLFVLPSLTISQYASVLAALEISTIHTGDVSYRALADAIRAASRPQVPSGQDQFPGWNTIPT